MSLYKSTFSIRHLEEFSGVKAHTIRMWEKRYGLLAPDRTGTNIRTYGLDELKTILNVAYLNKHGHKISRIAAMPPIARDQLVRDTSAASPDVLDLLNSLKLAMLGFDEDLFRSVCDGYLLHHDLRMLVEKLFVPLLEHIGILWQTNAICPAQEHFVSNIIRHQLIAATASLPQGTYPKDRTFVLYLPENEIHELGLLFVNYVLRSKGERTIYLGQSVPSADLVEVSAVRNGELVLLTILMAEPPAEEIVTYLGRMRESLSDRRISFMVTGGQMKRLENPELPPGVRIFGTMNELMAAVDKLIQ